MFRLRNTLTLATLAAVLFVFAADARAGENRRYPARFCSSATPDAFTPWAWANGIRNTSDKTAYLECPIAKLTSHTTDWAKIWMSSPSANCKLARMSRTGSGGDFEPITDVMADGGAWKYQEHGDHNDAVNSVTLTCAVPAGAIVYAYEYRGFNP